MKKFVLVMFVFIDFVTAYGQESSEEITVNGATLTRKFEWLLTNAESGKTYGIVLDRDETLPATQNLDYDGRVVTIILRGRGAMRKIISNLQSYKEIFEVRSGVTLVLLDNITLITKGSQVSIGIGGSLKMHNNTVVTGGSGIEINGGSFYLSGGNITGNSSYGVSVRDGGNFSMSAGSISGNFLLKGEPNPGFGVFVENGTFTMTGGSISGNDSGIVVYNGGVFTMQNGTISGNQSFSGVYVSGGAFTMTGGSISGNKAGYGGADLLFYGVYVGGGGVFVENGTFNLNSPATKASISGNTYNPNTKYDVYVGDGGIFRVNGLRENSY